MTHAIHAQGGGHHVVGIGNLRVVLVKDDDGTWFAQGLEIDYGAQGSSMEDAQKRFEKGLACTIREHLKRFGSIERLLEVAPRQVWREVQLAASRKMRFSQISIHQITEALSLPETVSFPYPAIEYVEQAAAC